MRTVDTRPAELDIDQWAGDTLTIHVNLAAEVVAGRTWAGQLRRSKTSKIVDALFQTLVRSDGCDFVLVSADSARLTAKGAYTGYYDIELSYEGSDPVTTVVRGQVRLDPDVTRYEP